MRASDKERVQRAKQQEQAQGSNRANHSGAGVANSTEQIIEDMSDKLAVNIADQVAFRSLQKAVEKLGKGEFSDRVSNYVGSLMGGFDESLNRSYLAIDREIDPKYLLQSSSESNSGQSNSVTITVEAE